MPSTLTIPTGSAPGVTSTHLHRRLAAAGLPVASVRERSDGQVEYTLAAGATQGQIDAAEALITAWVTADWDRAGSWDEVRTKRDALLAACDFTQLPDAPLTSQQKTDWATYRQELRDLPETYATGGPTSVVWPTEPQ